MKAIRINKYGGSEVLKINNITKPQLAKNQVLVRVYAAGINPFDVKLCQGLYKDLIPLQFPVTLGGDFAGIVIEVEASVTDFKEGDKVYGQAIVLGGGSGGWAEFAAANAKGIAKKPQKTNFIESAALPLVGSSAVQALEEHIKLTSGQKILVHGGAGGIGHIAIQLAKAKGAYVATTVSANDKEFVHEVGADEVIDYKNQKFEKLLKDFDAVFDTVGGETTDRSFKVLKKGGVIVSMLGQPSKVLAQEHGVRVIGQNTQTDKDHLDRLRKWADEGKIKAHIDKIFPLEEVKEAFKYKEKESPRGKIVLKIAGNL